MRSTPTRAHTQTRRFLTAATVLVAGGVLMLPAPSAAGAAPKRSGAALQNGNEQTGKCATRAGGRSTENNVRLVQFTCDSDPARRWVLRLAG